VAGMQFENTGVELRGAAKTYRNAGAVVNAVRGIDVSIKRGETVALLGPNGAGRSTTIDLLLGLIAPDSGTVSLLGGPPKEAVARGMVAAMRQAGALIRDVKVRELLAMVAALHPRPLEVDEALALAGLSDVAGRRTHKLSGGQAQRVRLAQPDVCTGLDQRQLGMTYSPLGMTRTPATLTVHADLTPER
jgi:ABC-2 type transport system ATP-binding protein